MGIDVNCGLRWYFDICGTAGNASAILGVQGRSTFVQCSCVDVKGFAGGRSRMVGEK